MKRIVLGAGSIMMVVLVLGACISGGGYDEVMVSGNYSEYAPSVYAVLPFESRPADTGIDPGDLEDYRESFGEYHVIGENGPSVAQEAFEDAVILTGSDVVVRSRVIDVLNEIEFQSMSGLTEEDAARIGTMVNADSIIVGTITQYNYYNVAVSVRALDVERGIVLWSASGYRNVWDFEDDPGEALRTLAREMMEEVADQLDEVE